MQHVRALMESRSMQTRIPDQSLIAGNLPGANYAVAARGDEYAFFYSPNGLPIHAVLGKINGSHIKASWYNPRNGEYSAIGIFANSGISPFIPPTSGRGEDWVLVLDSVQ
ncbi:putative collagen-binding domain-containing protein [Paenibacillus solisilvae]|uniref:Collagen-binding domain-containing protein n=1 Tax=Paenibacillus solisilvae TaxID=2486751 RepID=A0ABW0VS44_9BACL